jgi:NTE family protein
LDRLGPLGKGLNLIMEQGIYKGEYLKQWLSEQLDAKGKKTFGDIKLLDPGSTLKVDQQYRLVVMASDISHGELCRFPWSYGTFGVQADSAEIVEAVRASMSIPFFYAPQKMKSSAGEDSWFVDGGMLSNFPIDVFDRTDQQRPRWPTFGIKLSAQPTAAQGIEHKVTGTVTLTEAMIGTMTGFYDRMHIDDPSVRARTIFVDTMKVRATDFDIDEPTQQQLYESGRAAATKFLDGGQGTPAWDWDTYLEKYWKPVSP